MLYEFGIYRVFHEDGLGRRMAVYDVTKRAIIDVNSIVSGSNYDI